MSVSSLTKVHELSPAELCNYIEYDYYQDIRKLLEQIKVSTESLAGNKDRNEHSTFLNLLFLKLEAESLQMIRNDEQVIFPLIRKKELKRTCGGTKMPVQLIHLMDVKILALLEKMRHFLHNYLPEKEYVESFDENNSNLFRLEQQLQQAIYIKENLLLFKVKDKFNQVCSGNCRIVKT
jgi:iron-sulfur cluster repair protein YtfE (RIC family)